MGRGKSADDAGIILYGKTRPRGEELPIGSDWRRGHPDLDAAQAQTASGWFSNYRGWSGTYSWVAKADNLPAAWQEQATKIEDEQIDYTGKDAVIDAAESGKLRKPLECDLEILYDLPGQRENETYLHVNAGVKKPGTLEENGWWPMVKASSLLAVEELTSAAGEWKFHQGIEELLYVSTNIEGSEEILGSVTVGIWD